MNRPTLTPSSFFHLSQLFPDDESPLDFVPGFQVLSCKYEQYGTVIEQLLSIRHASKCLDALITHSLDPHNRPLWCRGENRPGDWCVQRARSLHVASPGFQPGALASEPVLVISKTLASHEVSCLAQGQIRKKLAHFLMKHCSKYRNLSDVLKNFH